MGLFDQLGSLLGGVQGQSQQQQSSPFNLNNLIQMLGQSSGGSGGGLQSIINSLQQNGLGDLVSSWIGTGQNANISPQQVEQALGSDVVKNIAQQCGTSVSQASNQLSQILPQLVDKLTPNGQVPEQSKLEQLLGVLQSQLKQNQGQ